MGQLSVHPAAKFLLHHVHHALLPASDDGGPASLSLMSYSASSESDESLCTISELGHEKLLISSSALQRSDMQSDSRDMKNVTLPQGSEICGHLALSVTGVTS